MWLTVRAQNSFIHLKLRILLPTHSRTCLENLFFHKLLANQGKMTNQQRTTGSCVKIIGEVGKSSCKHGREQKFRRTPYPRSCEHCFCLSKKPTGDGSQRTVCEYHTNYTNIVFANEMFASVYAAFHVYRHLERCQLKKKVV